MTLDVDPGRAARAAAALSAGAVSVERDGPDTYRVRSFTADRQYRVRLNGELRCDCPDVQYRGTEACKHIISVALVEGLT